MFKRHPFFAVIMFFASINCLSGCGDTKTEDPSTSSAPDTKQASAAGKQGESSPGILSNPYNEPDQPSKRKKK